MIRTYTPDDQPALLAILQHNISQYFAPSEEQDFIDYLDRHVEDYYVVEDNGHVIGAGGINYFPDEHTARLSWDLIHPDYQGRGIGGRLVRHRIDRIKERPAIRDIIVRTTQLVYPFYEKYGFVLEKVEKDFWAPGFDLYQMRMAVSIAADRRDG